MDSDLPASDAPAIKTASTLSLRKADFRIGLALLGIFLSLFVYTLGFPMSGSYGGVENQWYVSPALFPLFVLSVLIICTISLLISAIKGNGTSQFSQLSSWLGDMKTRHVKDKWFVITLLVFYVYIYIPSVDFYLATTLFLLSLVLRFYMGFSRRLLLILFTHYCLITILFILRYNFEPSFYFFSTQISNNESLIAWSDGFTTLAIILLFGFCASKPKECKKKIAHVLIAVFIVPLVLIILFAFGLYVPMPVEYGTVMNMLNTLIYDVLQY